MDIAHYHFKTLLSTNTWAKEQLKTFSKHQLTVITADEQTKGRGRYNRKWLSPKGDNLYASYCFFIDEKRQDYLSLTSLFAVSLAHVLEKQNILCQIKRPNDLLVNQKKIAGILCETQPLTPYRGVVIGIGLNINMSKDLFDTIEQPVTSLYYETGTLWEISFFLDILNKTFSEDLQCFLSKGLLPFLPAFRNILTGF